MKKIYIAPHINVIKMEPMTPVASSPEIKISEEEYDPNQSLSVGHFNWETADDEDVD